MPTEDAVFFDQVGHGLLLPLVEPTDERGQQKAERQCLEHGGREYTTDRAHLLEDLRPSYGTLRVVFWSEFSVFAKAQSPQKVTRELPRQAGDEPRCPALPSVAPAPHQMHWLHVED